MLIQIRKLIPQQGNSHIYSYEVVCINVYLKGIAPKCFPLQRLMSTMWCCKNRNTLQYCSQAQQQFCIMFLFFYYIDVAVIYGISATLNVVEGFTNGTDWGGCVLHPILSSILPSSGYPGDLQPRRSIFWTKSKQIGFIMYGLHYTHFISYLRPGSKSIL